MNIKEMWQEGYENIVGVIAEYGLKVVLAIVLLIVGLFVIKHVMKVVRKGFEKSKMDISVAKFLTSAISMILKVLLIITLLEQLEIPNTSLVAIIGAAGLGIGFALQGTLSNLAGGILILMLRPYSVHDYIRDAAGNEGTVEDIQVFYTTLKTLDNRTIIIPNGDLSNASIINYSKEDKIRVSLEFGVDYKADTELVRSTILKEIEDHPLVVDKDKTVVKISQHGDSAVIFLALVWALNTDFRKVKLDLMESVKLAFDKNAISIPYPHMDVTILNDK